MGNKSLNLELSLKPRIWALGVVFDGGVILLAGPLTLRIRFAWGAWS